MDSGLDHSVPSGTHQPDFRFYQHPNLPVAARGEIQDYLKKSGSSDYARFLKAIAAQSPAGAFDGNPNSSSAQNASETFGDYAWAPPMTATAQNQMNSTGTASAKSSAVGFGLLADVGTIRAAGFKAQTYSLTPRIPIRLGGSDRVRLDIGIPLNYTRLQGAR